jgi:ABC-type branched-subunit amino acid transport system ATPase component
MHKYLPENFRTTTFDEDSGNVPDYDTIVNKYGLTKYLDEKSGDDIEQSTTVIDEKTETAVQRLSGGEFLRLKVAMGFYENKRVIVINSERYGFAPVTNQDNVEIRKMPYSSHSVQVLVSK